MKWEYYCECSLQMKFKQNMYVFLLIIWFKTVRLVKPVKHDLSSPSSVFTLVSPISKTEILSGKYPAKFDRILPGIEVLYFVVWKQKNILYKLSVYYTTFPKGLKA